MKHWPKKPAKLDHDCAWVSVVAAEGTGVPVDERAWCCECVGVLTVDCVLRDAGRMWYDQTDQCGEAKVTLRMELADGRVCTGEMELEPVIACKLCEVLWPNGAGGAA